MDMTGITIQTTLAPCIPRGTNAFDIVLPPSPCDGKSHARKIFRPWLGLRVGGLAASSQPFGRGAAALRLVHQPNQRPIAGPHTASASHAGTSSCEQPRLFGQYSVAAIAAIVAVLGDPIFGFCPARSMVRLRRAAWRHLPSAKMQPSVGIDIRSHAQVSGRHTNFSSPAPACCAGRRCTNRLWCDRGSPIPARWRLSSPKRG